MYVTYLSCVYIRIELLDLTALPGLEPGSRLVKNTQNHLLDFPGSQSDRTAYLWDLQNAKQKRAVAPGKQVLKVLFCNDDQWVVWEVEKFIVVEQRDTGVYIMICFSYKPNFQECSASIYKQIWISNYILEYKPKC